MSPSVDMLEKRLEALEHTITGKKKLVDKIQDVTELLIHTRMMIASALSLREVITTLLGKMPKLNEYLDPTYSANDLEIELKRQYVMLLYPELKETSQLISKFESLTPAIDSKSILQVTEHLDKLNELASVNLKIYEQSRETTTNVLKALQMYNDITISIRKLFADLDKSVTELENSLHPNVPIEE